MISRKTFESAARDTIALGSPVFFLLVIARVSMLSNPEYLSQFIISGILFIALMFSFKSDMHSGLGLIILVFTILYYKNPEFNIFAGIVFAGFLCSLFYINKNRKSIIKGFLFGAISIGISYYITQIIFGSGVIY